MFGKNVMRVLPALLATLLCLSGCDKKPETETVTLEKDVVLSDGSLAREWVVEEIVPVPSPKVEAVISARPSKEHVWIPGAWHRDQEKWVWESGRWAKPPHSRARWLEGHWRWQDSKWHWRPGEWIVPDGSEFVTEAIVIPGRLPEVVPEKPADKDAWIAGSWDWDGRWIWIPGYWTNTPDPDAVWVPGHWDDRGLDGSFRWIGGRWMVTG